MRKLTIFQKYDPSTLTPVGWTCDATVNGEPEPGATEGYNVYDYFDPDGTYLGRDSDGIEPLFADEPSTL